MIEIKVDSGDGLEVKHELNEDTVIGRDPSCGIVLSFPAVSRNHAKIVLENNHCRVVDLESKAGTYLNGKRVTSPVELLDGDIVRVGPVALNVRYLISSKPERTQQFAMGPKSLRFDDVGSGKLTRRIAIDTEHFSQTRRYFKESKALGASPEEISEQLESLLQLSTSILALKKRRALFPEVAQQLLDFFKEADRVLVLETDKNGVQQVQEVKHGPHSKKRGDDSFDRTILNHAVDERQAVLHGTREGEDIPAGNPSSVICAPLWHSEKVLGALYLDGRTAKFSENHLRFLTAMANIVASALQNVLLFEAVSEEAAQRAHLARYFSKDLVERILADKIKPARKGDIHAATILMVDLCGFSRLTNQVSPSVLITSLNQYFGAMQRIIFKNRGTVERFGGDSILAYWGVIEQDKYPAWRTCLAAITMQNEMLPLNFKLKKGQTPTLSIAIGINTGEVIAGDVGSEERYEFTVLGDAVNMSRRLQELAGPNQIFAGANTVKSVGRSALFQELPAQRVKGRETPLQLFLLYAVRTASDSGVRYELSLGVVLMVDGDEEYGRATALRYVRTENGYTAHVTLSLLDEVPPGVATMTVNFANVKLSFKVRVIGDPLLPDATAYWSESVAAALTEGPVETEVALIESEMFLKALKVI